jgi:hypothetical protein
MEFISQGTKAAETVNHCSEKNTQSALPFPHVLKNSKIAPIRPAILFGTDRQVKQADLRTFA